MKINKEGAVSLNHSPSVSSLKCLLQMLPCFQLFIKFRLERIIRFFFSQDFLNLWDYDSDDFSTLYNSFFQFISALPFMFSLLITYFLSTCLTSKDVPIYACAHVHVFILLLITLFFSTRLTNKDDVIYSTAPLFNYVEAKKTTCFDSNIQLDFCVLSE